IREFCCAASSLDRGRLARVGRGVIVIAPRARFVAMRAAVSGGAFLAMLDRASMRRQSRNDPHNRAVARGGIGRGIGFPVIQENLADPAIGKSGESSDVVQTAELELKGFARAAIGQATARGHRAASRAMTSQASRWVSNEP